MPKTTEKQLQDKLQDLLVTLRNEAGLRQVDLAKKLHKPQSFVSKYESGERFLDLPELYILCQALGVPFVVFAERFEKSLR